MTRAHVGIVLALAGLACGSFYDLEADDLQSGLPVPMSYYRGKAVIIVNVASKCSYTDTTYAQLNQLHAKYSSRGLAILAFPCNGFGAQEPGSPEELFSFATSTKRVKFDLFRKVEVNGPTAHPVFQWLLGRLDDCSDEDASCASWAEQGECTTNPEFMHSACKLSCKLCTAPVGEGAPIRWNFESFLVSRTGQLVERFAAPNDDLTSSIVTEQIEALLAEKLEL